MFGCALLVSQQQYPALHFLCACRGSKEHIQASCVSGCHLHYKLRHIILCFHTGMLTFHRAPYINTALTWSLLCNALIAFMGCKTSHIRHVLQDVQARAYFAVGVRIHVRRGLHIIEPNLLTRGWVMIFAVESGRVHPVANVSLPDPVAAVCHFRYASTLDHVTILETSEPLHM